MEEKFKDGQFLNLPVLFNTDIGTSIKLICAVMVASKHPEFAASGGAEAVAFAKELQLLITPALPTEMVIMLENGWKSETNQN